MTPVEGRVFNPRRPAAAPRCNDFLSLGQNVTPHAPAGNGQKRSSPDLDPLPLCASPKRVGRVAAEDSRGIRHTMWKGHLAERRHAREGLRRGYAVSGGTY